MNPNNNLSIVANVKWIRLHHSSFLAPYITPYFKSLFSVSRDVQCFNIKEAESLTEHLFWQMSNKKSLEWDYAYFINNVNISFGKINFIPNVFLLLLILTFIFY